MHSTTKPVSAPPASSRSARAAGSVPVALADIVIRAWHGADCAVTRAAFDSPGDAQADANPRIRLSSHPISAPPPPGIHQPLPVRLRLEEHPQARRRHECRFVMCVRLFRPSSSTAESRAANAFLSRLCSVERHQGRIGAPCRP